MPGYMRPTRQTRLTALAETAADPSLPPRVARSRHRQEAASSNIHDFLANELGTEIVAGIHAPGTLLPNESELRERFGVSRTALREAFRVLTAKGLIVSR